ncbi:hypothetical protein [Streptomyces verrucosisporus]|uniref:hypothetical protein n=1 Tax=Streptomyces verrucosisporus TaxID=1695161 RepID=UPI0019D0CD24|nr:hypothetical protein [Streptomyces verrucosisporus]
MDSRAWDERYAAADLVWGGEPNRWVVREDLAESGLASRRAERVRRPVAGPEGGQAHAIDALVRMERPLPD